MSSVSADLEAAGQAASIAGEPVDSSWRQRAGRWIRRAARVPLDHPHSIPVALITAAFAFVYCWFSLLRLWRHDGGGGFDLAIFDQAVRGYAHFGAPRSSVLKDLDTVGTGMPQLGDHFSPILVVLAPFYWIHDGPSTLLVAQGVLFALAIPPIWIFARRALGTPAAYFVAVAFGVYWPLQSALAMDFHEVAFAVPIMAVMLERAQAGRQRQAAIAAVALLMVKEDMGFVVFVLGVLWFWQGSRRLGAVVAAGGIGAVAFLNFVGLPLFGGVHDRNWTFYALGKNPHAALRNVVHHPVHFITLLFDPPDIKVNTLAWLLLPVLFLALRSSLFLLAVPLLMERFLSDLSFLWGRYWQYNAYVAVIIFCAAVEGARKLPWPRLSRPAWAVAACAAGLAVLPRGPLWQLTDSQLDGTSPPVGRAAVRAMAVIPSHEIVAASSIVQPSLDARDIVLNIHAYYDWGMYRPPARPQWVISFHDDACVQALGPGYRLVYSDTGFMVYERS